MRRRTVQYLVLLSLLAVSVHLYFNHADPFATPEWMDKEFDLGPDRYRDNVGGPPAKAKAKPPTRPPSRPSRPFRAPLPADVRKRDAVVDAFKHAWSAYERDAMGADEYHPLSHRGSNLGAGGGIGYTVVDALDTMLLMGLDAEYARAREWVAEELSFDQPGHYSTFETTIRVLGGLLSAYHLSGDALYLRHATDLGERLLPAFGALLPSPAVDLRARRGSGAGTVGVADATTLQLEFRYLAQLTGRAEFWHKAEGVMRVVNKARLPNGLAPISVGGDGAFARSTIRMGSNGDSYYEYLLKQYLQTNQTEPVYLQMYADAMRGVHAHLLTPALSPRSDSDSDSPANAKETETGGALYIAELLPVPGALRDWRTSWDAQPKQEHLACFLAGALMLGAATAHRAPAASPGVSRPPHDAELTETGRADWAAGVGVLEGCLDTTRTRTGLAPEGFNFRTARDPGPPAPPGEERAWYIKGAGQPGAPPYDARYMLRPEISESLFLAWRLTGAPRYRAAAWDLFSAIERHCRLPGGGYATVLDVGALPVVYGDKQETFFLSETLKYLFLTFADEGVLDLGEVVLNTEAHPLPIFNPSITPLFTEYA
ncbi:glycoside hydrolase [Mycena maculata]|uniref:alpha-1,2-Mannosidase n=1 Tax=Mycena maculata TaxID=230809 RepID=A0AAD7HPN9_9AGAR|nr:glycoside hydrolase [Mycena maculata]